MSTLVFTFRLLPEPDEDDLLHMQAARAMVASITGIAAEKLSSGLKSGHERLCTFSAHRDHIPRAWVKAADGLTKRGLCQGYDWYGELEGEKPPMIVMGLEQEKQIKDLFANALYTDEGWHKQWYLWKIVEALGLDLSSEWDEDYPEPDKGIAP